MFEGFMVLLQAFPNGIQPEYGMAGGAGIFGWMIWQKLGKLSDRFDKQDDERAEMKSRMSSMETDIKTIKEDINELKRNGNGNGKS